VKGQEPLVAEIHYYRTPEASPFNPNKTAREAFASIVTFQNQRRNEPVAVWASHFYRNEKGDLESVLEFTKTEQSNPARKAIPLAFFKTHTEMLETMGVKRERLEAGWLGRKSGPERLRFDNAFVGYTVNGATSVLRISPPIICGDSSNTIRYL